MPYTDELFLLGRILFGGYFLFSGLNHFMKFGMLKGYAQSKGVPMPEAAVVVTGILLLLGGLGVVFGIEPTWSALFLVVFLLGVTPKMHAFWAVKDPQQKMSDMINFQKNMALLGAALMMLSVDTPWVYRLF